MEKKGAISVFRRLFLVATCLILVIYIVLTGFFVTFVYQQRDIQMAGHANRVTNSAAVIEQQLQAVSNVELQLLNDSRVKRLALGLYGDRYERSELIWELQSTIQSTDSINSIIENIVLVFPHQGIEISADKGYAKKEYVREDSNGRHNIGTNRLTVSDGDLEMKISSPLQTSLDENYIPDYEICITLSKDFLESFIRSFRNEQMEGAFWVFHNGQSLSLLFREGIEESHMQHWQQVCQNKGELSFSMVQATCDHGQYYFSSQHIGQYGLTLVTYQDSRAVAWKLGKSLWIIAGMAIIMGLIFGLLTIWANRSVNKPIRRLLEAFQQVRDGMQQVRIQHNAKDEFGYIYDSFNDSQCKLEELIENIKEQKILLQNAELMQLQSQINPHFLYNSFYNIKFMAHNEEYEQIETFVMALAKYYRFINKETEQDVNLASEVAHMENYIEIQQMRFGDKITVEKMELPYAVRELKVPKLILQPIIENAYNYGLNDKLNNGLLRIGYALEDKWLYIRIEDNGESVTEEKLEKLRRQICTYEGESLNHAMTNIQRRLKLAYGDECGISLDISPLGGLRVAFRLDTQREI